MRLRYLKVFAVICLLFSLVACNAATVQFTFSEYSGEVTISGNDVLLKGTLKFTDCENMEFILSEPENIKNTTYIAKKQSNTVGIGDITFSADSVLNDSPVFLLFEALKSIYGTPLTVNVSGTQALSLQNSEKTIDIEFNSDEMKIVSLQYRGYRFEF